MPNGPISRTTITGDTTPPDEHEYELVLKFKLNSYDEELDAPALGAMYDKLLDDCQDGRRPFAVEMMSDGVYRCLKRAIYECVCAKMQEEYGNELIPDEDHQSCTARWLLEADEAMKTAPKPWFCGRPRAEMRDVTDV